MGHIGLCKLLIDGTKPLIEIIMTFINEVLWNLLRKQAISEVMVPTIGDAILHQQGSKCR